jgi:hypothetical protein
LVIRENTLHILTDYAPLIGTVRKNSSIHQEIKMNPDSSGQAMSQKIFSMNLDVETVSLYLLCCAVADTGAKITHATLREKWNGSRSGLESELIRLQEKNILRRDDAETEGGPVYLMVDEKKWC